MKRIIALCGALALGACATNHEPVPEPVPEPDCCVVIPTRPAFMDKVSVSAADPAIRSVAERLLQEADMRLVRAQDSYLLFRLAKGTSKDGPCVVVAVWYNGQKIDEGSIVYEENVYPIQMRGYINRAARLAIEADRTAAHR